MKSKKKLFNLTICLLVLTCLVSCSDQQAAPWELSEFEFDWRLDWPIAIIGYDEPDGVTISQAVGDLCYFHLNEMCHTIQWKEAIRRLENMAVDFYLLPRPPNDGLQGGIPEEPAPYVPDLPVGRRFTEYCVAGPCPNGILCDDYGQGYCEDATPCSRLCDRINACYESVEECKQKCELMLKGPCAGGACPLSEAGILQYVGGVERLTCEEMIEWDGLRLFPKMFGQQAGWISPARDCSKIEEAAITQRSAFISFASTAEVAERIQVCGEFRECAEQLHCLKQEGLIDEDI